MNHKFINIKNCLCRNKGTGIRRSHQLDLWRDFLVTSNESDGTIGVRIKVFHLHAPSTQGAHQNHHLNLGNGDRKRSIIQFRPVILKKKHQSIMVIGFNLLLPTNHHKNTAITIRLQLSEALCPVRRCVVGLLQFCDLLLK